MAGGPRTKRLDRRTLSALGVAATLAACLLLAAIALPGNVNGPAGATASTVSRQDSPSTLLNMSPGPSARATVGEVTGWIAIATELRRFPDDPLSVEARVGPGFRILVLGATTVVAGQSWQLVRWSTPGRTETSWMPAQNITRQAPLIAAEADVDALDLGLATYLRRLGTRVGLRVVDVTDELAYAHNADLPFTVASSIKVPIMLSFLVQLEGNHREPTTAELRLLRAMIERSDNDAGEVLNDAIGKSEGLSAFMSSIHVTGFEPNDRGRIGGWSTLTPRAMAQILEALHRGDILTDVHRALALRLMSNVIPSQRFGVGETAPAGAWVAMKEGWVQGPDGTLAVNSSGIVNLTTRTYVIAVYTTGSTTLAEGKEIVNHACGVVADILDGTTASANAGP